MSVEVSGCYYHGDKPAVAVCAQCGAGICRECAVKDDRGRTICISCGNKILKEEHKQYRQSLKDRGGRFKSGKEFIKPGIIGLLIVLGVGAIFFNEGYISEQIGRCSDIYEFLGSILGMIMLAYMLFSIPFAIILMNDTFAPKYATKWDIFGKWYFKVWIAFFLGWIIFTFYWIRFLILKIKRKKMKE